jgi:EmrB/QacA subfamily drug resistance transporter
MNHHLTLRAKIIIMISVMASLFLVALDQTIITTALGKIVQDFNAFDQLSWIVTAYLVTTTITVPIAGKLSDLFGRKKLLLIGVSIFGIGSLLSGASPNITWLILSRAFQGIGGGIITANAFTIVGDLFAARERGKWQGLISSVFGVASVIGPLLGGFLTESHNVLGLTHTDWRWTFWINIPVAIGALIIISIFCPPLKHDAKPRVDFLGAGLIAVLLGVLIFAIDNTGQIFSGLLSATGLSLVGLRIIMYGIVLAALITLLLVESKAPEPIVNLRFFKNKNFSLIMVIAFLHGAAFLGAILYLTQFNQQVFGATPTQSGLMLLPLMAGLMTASITTGQIVSKIGKYKFLMVTGFIVMTISLGFLTTLTPHTAYFHEAIIMVFVGLGIGVALPLMNLAVQNEFEQKDLGAATSSSQLFRNLGSAIGTAIFGSLLTVGIATNLGDMKNDPYIITLRQSPAGAKIVTSTTDANTLLNINSPAVKSAITTGFDSGIAKLPTAAQAPLKTTFLKDQNGYTTKIENAFSNSIHDIFLLSTLLVAVAAVGTFFLKERTLRSAKSSDTPGEVTA